MSIKIKDIFNDELVVDPLSSGLGLIALSRDGRSVGLLIAQEGVKELRDVCNQFLGEATPILKPINFGGGGNTVIFVDGQVSQFSESEAATLKKLISGIVENSK